MMKSTNQRANRFDFFLVTQTQYSNDSQSFESENNKEKTFFKHLVVTYFFIKKKNLRLPEKIYFYL